MTRSRPLTAVILGMFLAAVLLAAVVLAGCSSSSGSGITGQAGAVAVAKALGCTGISPVDPPTYFARTEADATCQGHHADIAAFTTDQARDSWAAFVRAQGATVTTGHLYAVGTGY